MLTRVKISPDFARSIVMTDPTEVNILTLPNNLEPTVQRTFNLNGCQRFCHYFA